MHYRKSMRLDLIVRIKIIITITLRYAHSECPLRLALNTFPFQITLLIRCAMSYGILQSKKNEKRNEC